MQTKDILSELGGFGGPATKSTTTVGEVAWRIEYAWTYKPNPNPVLPIRTRREVFEGSVVALGKRKKNDFTSTMATYCKPWDKSTHFLTKTSDEITVYR